MKQFRVVTRKTWEGVDAFVPSIRECETWAKTEEEALDKLIERVKYFLSLPDSSKYILDRSRKEDGEVWYTLMVDAD